MKAKEITGLDCDGPTAKGIRLVLETRLDEMLALKPAAMDWSDDAGVHDMRVASRRLRSAVKDFAPFLKHRKVDRAVKSLKRIADALGAVRDDDVAIAELEKLASKAPPKVAVGIGQFVEKRKENRDAARVALAEAIANDRLALLRSEFDEALEAALKTRATAAGPTFRESGRTIISERLEECGKLARSLYRPFDVKALHRLRIASKRLRYALDLFAACSVKDIAPYEKEVAAMQGSLGDLHDCDVWIDKLGETLSEKTGTVPSGEEVAAAKSRAAAIWLLQRFIKARMSHYRDALGMLNKWEKSDFLGRLSEDIEANFPSENGSKG
jgi:CHAD domain-containing protein